MTTLSLPPDRPIAGIANGSTVRKRDPLADSVYADLYREVEQIRVEASSALANVRAYMREQRELAKRVKILEDEPVLARVDRCAVAAPDVFWRILDVTLKDLKAPRPLFFSTSRHKSVVLARGIVVLLARQRTYMSFPEIAKGIGRPCHSSVITSLQRLELRIKAGDDHFGEPITDIIARIERGLEEA
ncbi:MAG: hypothetical protein DWQ20_00900 [Actinobacteria bacterium]|nr:MAG: hypothetical protein DWQ20_00900 [Actinomycetota bacterium]